MHPIHLFHQSFHIRYCMLHRFQDASASKSCSKINTEVRLFHLECILIRISISPVITIVTYIKTKLWTCCEINSSQATKSNIITKIYRNVDWLLFHCCLVNFTITLVEKCSSIYTKSNNRKCKLNSWTYKETSTIWCIGTSWLNDIFVKLSPAFNTELHLCIGSWYKHNFHSQH